MEQDDSLKNQENRTITLEEVDLNRKMIDGTPAALKLAEVAGGAAGILLFTGLIALLSFYSSSMALFTVAFVFGILGVVALIVGLICFFASFKRKNELTIQETETYKLLKLFSVLVLLTFVFVYIKAIQILTK